MPKTGNLYDLVERAALRQGIPRLKLWLKTLRAIEQGQLQVSLGPEFQPNPVWPSWITGARAAVERRNDPNGFAHVLERITVSIPHFQDWLRKANRLPRGPERGATGYREADRQVLDEIRKLIESGKERSAYGAALTLAHRIAGHGTPDSKAKRISALYRMERGERRG
jgi:hypothetical protein